MTLAQSRPAPSNGSRCVCAGPGFNRAVSNPRARSCAELGSGMSENTRKKAALPRNAAPSILFPEPNSHNKRRIAVSAIGHLLGHVHNQLAVLVLNLAQQAPKLVEKSCFFANAAPRNIVGRFALRQVRQLRRFLTVIKELIKWALECAREFLQSLDGWNSVAILDSRDVTAK